MLAALRSRQLTLMIHSFYFLFFQFLADFGLVEQALYRAENVTK